jgi:hypothetical protein
VKEASQISLSMSSLIDFENNRSSQDDMQLLESSDDTNPAEQEQPEVEQNARKEMLLEVSLNLASRGTIPF